MMNFSEARQTNIIISLTSASTEMSLSKLKLIRARLRSIMGQDRLIYLTAVPVEADITKKLHTEGLVKSFSGTSCKR